MNQTIQAFVLDKETRLGLENIASQLEAEMTVQAGGIEDSANWIALHEAPDILIVDSGEGLNLEDSLRNLAQHCPPQIKVIVLGKKADLALYRSLLFAGISDYHTKPLDPDGLRASLLKFLGQEKETVLLQGRKVCVVGTGGGQGTSTLASNVSWQMADAFKQRVALVDLDTYQSQHPILLGKDYEPSLAQLMANVDKIDDTLLAHTAHQVHKNLHLFYAEKMNDSDIDAQKAKQCVQALSHHYGMVVVDIPDLRSQAARDLVASADVVVWVSDYNLNSSRFLSKAVPQKRNPNQRQIVIGNQSRSGKKRIPKRLFEQSLDLNVAMELPYDDKPFLAAERDGVPLVTLKGKLTRQIKSLSSLICFGHGG
nr:AAA family ATPase [Vibrio sp. S9_S30]